MRVCHCCWIWPLLVWLTAVSTRADEYLDSVKPLLRTKCVSCHGGLKQEGGLRLDTGRLAIQGGQSGAALVAGDTAASRIWQRVTATEPDQRMPPDAEALSAEDLKVLEHWIDAGAPSPADELPQSNPSEHWAFRPLEKTAVPNIPGLQPIDAFIENSLAQQGLTHAPPADPRSLVRRLWLDVAGLPPSTSSLAQWSARLTQDPQSIEQLIELLLASPRHGERFAQLWLDVVRYADTHGFEVNTPRPNAWPYRDYVVRAINADKPFNRFAAEQVAGEQLGEDAATGFLVAAAVLLPGQIGQDDASKRLARQDALDEVIIGTSATFFGLTVGCARCHDHKFDPISQRDYYALQAFFSGVEYDEREIIDIKQLDTLRREKKQLETPRMLFAGKFRECDVTYLLNRGDPEQRSEEVGPALPGIVAELSADPMLNDAQRRRALADWLERPTSGLIARVIVNRVWQSHFGVGFVETASDFGLNGTPPSHPELLDWLASELVAHDWSLKWLELTILSSRTYQQSARLDPESIAKDADNRWLWRFPARRLPAEAIRDSVLQVSGSLNLEMGGPGFDFFKVRGGLTGFPPLEKFTANELRRMIYSHKIRMERVPVFGVFDCPDAGQPSPKRSESTTPIQALNLFNSDFIAEQADAFATLLAGQSAGHSTSKRDSAQSETSQRDATELEISRQVDEAFQLALGRAPDEMERRSSVEVVREHGLSVLCRVLFNSNEFLFLP